jgi:hypothetical protein
MEPVGQAGPHRLALETEDERTVLSVATELPAGEAAAAVLEARDGVEKPSAAGVHADIAAGPARHGGRKPWVNKPWVNKPRVKK